MAEIHEENVVICNKRGLHARASAKFAALAHTFPAVITVEKDGVIVSGHSIMSLLLLAAANGETITIKARGIDAEKAVEALVKLAKNRFDEPV